MSVTDALQIRTADDTPKIASNFCKHIFEDFEIKTQEYYGQEYCLVEEYPFSIDFKRFRPAIVPWAELDIDSFGFIPNRTVPIFYSRKAQHWIKCNGGWDIPPLRNVVLKAVLGLIISTDYSLILKLDEPEREVLIRHAGKLTLLDDSFWTEERLRSFADIPYETGKLPGLRGGDTLYIRSTVDPATVTRRFCEQAFDDFRIHAYREQSTGITLTKAVSNDIEIKTLEYGQEYRQCHDSHQRNLGFVPNILMSISCDKDKTLDDDSPQKNAIFRGIIGLIRTTDYNLALTYGASMDVALLYKPGAPPRVTTRYLSDAKLRLLGEMPFNTENVTRFHYFPT